MDIESIVKEAMKDTKFAQVCKAMSEGRMVFRKLTEDEIRDHVRWANENYIPFTKIEGHWHPVVQMQCVKINNMNSDYTD